MSEKSEALRLADALQQQAVWEGHYGPSYLRDLLPEAAAELRRLYAERTAADGVINDLVAKVRGLQTQRDALLEAAREGLSVCVSVSISHDRRITRDGCVLYAQTEEWCRWAETEVGPKIRAAIKTVEE